VVAVISKVVGLAPGTDVMILKIFSSKNLANLLAGFAQTTAIFDIFNHDIGFREKRHFFAENWQKSQKIVIITSTPGTAVFKNRKFRRHLMARKSVNFCPLQCRNSPYSMGELMSCRMSGRRVTMPLPRGRKSLKKTTNQCHGRYLGHC
jgi:hypothetical protein